LNWISSPAITNHINDKIDNKNTCSDLSCADKSICTIRQKQSSKSFGWYYIQTKHFDIYFTNNGETLAEFTAHAAEDALSKIQESFNYSINNRVTLIIYNSQNDFQETNVTDSYLSEGIEGFTELFKNRVVVQYHGSYKQFRHLIHHELVHAVMNDMFYGGSLQNIIANNITVQIPIWFSEGMAEYQALAGMKILICLSEMLQ
jgi:hypothetical protein